jgi:hypothetical protein
MIFDAQAAYDAQKKMSKHKMVVNRGFAVGVLKNDLVGVLLEPDGCVSGSGFGYA